MADKQAKKASNIRMNTGKGTLRYPKLSEIDFGTDDYPAKDGIYSANLIAGRNEPWVVELLAKLEPLHEAAIQRGEEQFKALKAEARKRLKSLTVNPLFTEILDPDTEEPTGDIMFTFKMRASGEYGKGKNAGKHWDSRPPVFGPGNVTLIKGFNFRTRKEDEDIRDVHLTCEPSIWSGSTASVSFEVGVDRETGEAGYFIGGTGMAGLKLGLAAVKVYEIVSGGERSAEGYGFDNDDDDSEAADSASNESADDSESDF